MALGGQFCSNALFFSSQISVGKVIPIVPFSLSRKIRVESWVGLLWGRTGSISVVSFGLRIPQWGWQRSHGCCAGYDAEALQAVNAVAVKGKVQDGSASAQTHLLALPQQLLPCMVVSKVVLRIVLGKCCQNRIAGFPVTLQTWAQAADEELFTIMPSICMIEPYSAQQSAQCRVLPVAFW